MKGFIAVVTVVSWINFEFIGAIITAMINFKLLKIVMAVVVELLELIDFERGIKHCLSCSVGWKFNQEH